MAEVVEKTSNPTQDSGLELLKLDLPKSEEDTTSCTEKSSSSNEEDVAAPERDKASEKQKLISIPPSFPKNGISILAHKLWIGNLDKRLTE